MNPEDVGRILDEIGERIGPAGEAAWAILVRGVWVDSVIGVLFGLFLTTVGVIITYFASKIGRQMDREDAGSMGFPLMIVGPVLGLTMMVIGVPAIFLNLQGVFVPEFKAIEYILRALP